jgi:hypothetical protein
LNGDSLHVHGGYPRFQDFHLSRTTICTQVRLHQQSAAPTRVQLLQLLEYDYFAYVVRPTASAPHTARRWLLCICCAPRLLITRPHGLYLNLVVHRDYSSLGRKSTTLTTSCVARLLVTWLHQFYCVYVVHSDAPSLPLDFSLVSRNGSHHAPGYCVSRLDHLSSSCTGCTAPMSFIRTRHLAARLLVGRSHWLSSCAPSLRRAPQVLITWPHRLYINHVARPGVSAPRAARRRLLRLCHVTACLVSSRVSSSTIPPMPCVSHWFDLDYSSSGCTGSIAPMSCIRTCRLDA